MFNFDQLKEKNPSLDIERMNVTGDEAGLVSREQVLEVARMLKRDFGFLQLMDAFGTDRMERKGRFEITYNIRNHVTMQRIFLKVRCDERDAHVPSLCSVWEGCNWNEREAYDMYGVTFDNHPDMRRMYMPQDFEHYPLRKDFPLMGVPGSLPLPHHEDSDPRFNVANLGE
jgi:NADH-quinone oxidoreductase subunit C